METKDFIQLYHEREEKVKFIAYVKCTHIILGNGQFRIWGIPLVSHEGKYISTR